jgi:hypothetical protein
MTTRIGPIACFAVAAAAFAAVASTEGIQIKWAQPPDPVTEPSNIYLGWNQYSEWCFGPLVADDWRCTTPGPVTDIHWWGSFVGWKRPVPPDPMPTHFHIQIWTDVPAGPGGRIRSAILGR